MLLSSLPKPAPVHAPDWHSCPCTAAWNRSNFTQLHLRDLAAFLPYRVKRTWGFFCSLPVLGRGPCFSSLRREEVFGDIGARGRTGSGSSLIVTYLSFQDSIDTRAESSDSRGWWFCPQRWALLEGERVEVDRRRDWAGVVRGGLAISPGGSNCASHVEVSAVDSGVTAFFLGFLPPSL